MIRQHAFLFPCSLTDSILPKFYVSIYCDYSMITNVIEIGTFLKSQNESFFYKVVLCTNSFMQK